MKTLLFLRHAHAVSGGEDHERPLTPDGERAARAVGRFLADLGMIPDAIFTSTALRARQTLTCAREGGHLSAPIHAAESLYESSPRKLLEEIRYAPEAAAMLLLVGHEPTWSRAVSRLTGGSHVIMRPATLARVDLLVDVWDDVAFGRGKLAWLVPAEVITEIGAA